MKNNIIKASEELFPIKAEMSLDEQSDQLLRQIGFKFGANWAIEKACEWLKDKLDYCEIECYDEKKFIKDFKEAMKGGEE